MKILRTLRNERGFVLLVVYVVVIFVTVFSMVLFARHRAAIQATERYQNRILAFNAAESGIDLALRELVTNSSLKNQTATETYTSSYTPMAQNEFRFVVSPVAGQSKFRRIDSEGCAPNCTNSSRAFQTSNITVYCQIEAVGSQPSVFVYGVYSSNSISMSGNSAFDSYNSKSGAYGGSNKSSEGAMAVNSTTPGALSLNGNAKINGSVVVGYEGNPNTVVTVANATITGSRSTLPEDWTVYDPPTTPEIHTDVNLSSVSGNNTVTLEGRDSTPPDPIIYHTSSLKISGNAKIVTTGAVKIYVDGAIDITGNGVVVPDNHPANLLLYSTGSSTVKIAGNGSFYGGVYAPNSAVTASGNGDVFGAVIAKTYTQSGNSATHFDLALKDLTGENPNPIEIARITAWQELHSLAWDTGQTV